MDDYEREREFTRLYFYYFMVACEHGHFEDMKEAYSEWEFDDCGRNMDTGVYLAGINGHANIVRFLLGNRNTGKDKRDFIFAFCEICKAGHVEIIQMLLDHFKTGAVRNTVLEDFVPESLDIAYTTGNTELVSLLHSVSPSPSQR